LPSLVNTVTVTQTAPPPPAPPSAPVAPPAPAVATGHAGGLGTLLRALYFLGSGAGVGILWVAAMYRLSPDAALWALAFAVTIVVLVLNFRLSSGRRP
jgi:Flp pilus assembly protein TadB